MNLEEYIEMKKKKDDFYLFNMKVELVKKQFNQLRLAYHSIYATPFNQIGKTQISKLIEFEKNLENSAQMNLGISAKEFENTGLVYSRYKIR